MSDKDLELHLGKLTSEGPDFTRKRIVSHSIAIMPETDDRIGLEVRQYRLDDGSFWESHVRHQEYGISCEWREIVPAIPRCVVPAEAETITKLRQQINHLVDERDALRSQRELEPWKVLATARSLCVMKSKNVAISSSYKLVWGLLANQIDTIMAEHGAGSTTPYDLKK